jgi:hypothetical protein
MEELPMQPRRIPFLVILSILTVVAVADAQKVIPPTQRETANQSAYYKGRAVIRESGFDFGKLQQHSYVSKKFYVVNEGLDTLEILKVDPG